LASIYAYNEPNPPSWDTSKVKVIEAGQDAQSLIDQIYSEMGGTNPPENGQFSDSRYALLFKPGSHDLDVRVGFYTQALGLGRTPTDTSIRNLRVENADPSYVTGALCVFWRGAENLKVDDTWGAVTWAVS